MAITVVQHANAAGLSVATLPVTLPNPVTAGNLLVVGVRAGDTDTINAPTDTGSNTYTNVAGATVVNTGNHKIQTWYVANCAGGSTFTVTANFGAAVGHPEIFVYEVSGIRPTSPVDTQTGGQAASGTAVASGSITTAEAGEYLFGFCTTSGNTGTLALGSGWTDAEFMQSNVNNPTGGGEDQITSAAGSFNATFTLGTSSAWSASVVAFFAAGRGGGFFASAQVSRFRDGRRPTHPPLFSAPPAPAAAPVPPIYGYSSN